MKESVGCTVTSTLCDPMGCTVHGIIRAKYWRISPNPGIKSRSSHQADSLLPGPPGKLSKKYGTKTEESPWCNLREGHSLQAQGSLGTIDDEALVSPRKDELSLTGQSDHKVQILLAGEGIVYRFILRGSAKVVWRAELMTKVGKNQLIIIIMEQ